MGNTETLPLQALDALYHEAKSFYETNYTSDKMHLMLVCNLNLDELANLVDRYFARYTEGTVTRSSSEFETFPKEHLGKFIWLHSHKNK